MFPEPLTPAAALEAADALRAGTVSVWVSPTTRHGDIFRRLISTYRVRVNDVPDAWLAALALNPLA
jgi:uncharacterized protein